MSPRVRIAALIVILLLVVLGGWSWRTMYQTPMAEARKRLASAELGVSDLREKLREGKTVRRELTDAVQRTLGKVPDTVSHRYVAGLRTIAERVGLAKVVVTHRDAEKVMSPLTRTTGVKPEDMRKRLRATPDFLLLRGAVSGEGTLEQVTRAIAEVDAQKWCQIESMSLRPVGKGGMRFALDLGVAAPLLPDLLEKEGPEPELVKERPEASWAMQAIVARNPFRAEPKVAAAQPTEVVQPAAEQPASAENPPPPLLPPPPPPYAEWKVTGLVVGSRTGVQVMMSNTRTNATVTVLRGAKVEDAVLVDGGGETAVFEIGGARYQVRVNQTLAERVPSTP